MLACLLSSNVLFEHVFQKKQSGSYQTRLRAFQWNMSLKQKFLKYQQTNNCLLLLIPVFYCKYSHIICIFLISKAAADILRSFTSDQTLETRGNNDYKNIKRLQLECESEFRWERTTPQTCQSCRNTPAAQQTAGSSFWSPVSTVSRCYVTDGGHRV